MSLSVANVGGTLTGGSTVVLASAGVTGAGKASFTTPDSTRLTPETVDLYVTPVKSTASDPGVARSGLKITYSNRETGEGCCSAQVGSVIIDVGFRWSLNQPDTMVDDALAMLRALLFNSAVSDGIKKGILAT